MSATTLLQWFANGQRFIHRGHGIFVQAGGRGGKGETLLLIHGFPTASWDWHRLWPQFEERFACVLAPDMIGFGYSDKPPAHPYSIFDQADLHETLLRERGVARVHILAHDYGDTVAQELLARDAERRAHGDGSLVIESVCFLNGGLFPEAHRARKVQKLLLGPLGPLLSRLMGEHSFGASFAAIFGAATQPSRTELNEFWQLVAHGGGSRIAHRLLHYIPERRANRARWVGALQTTRVPLRFIDGADDPVSGAHMLERYLELVPDPDTVRLEGIGHYPQIEAPERVWRAYAEFLDRLRGSDLRNL